MALKAPDDRCIPLCHKHHMQYHRWGRHSFSAKYDMDYEYVITTLNRIWKERNEHTVL